MNIIERTYTLNGKLKKRGKTTRIILHHRAGNGDVESIDMQHKKQGWTCIGYHFYIRKDGTIYRGRPEDTVGAHATNHNSDSIGICFEGNFETDTMPEVQKQAGIWLIHTCLKGKYTIVKIQGHRDVGATACPGKNFPFDEIVSAVKPVEKVETSTTQTYYTVKVTTNVLNVRAGAGTNYKVNTTIKKGEIYTIVEEKNGWGKLKSGAGWIKLSYATRTANTSTKITYNYYPACLSRYTSLVDALNSIGVNSSFANRRKIAVKNGVKVYIGTAMQNERLLVKLKAGKLIQV